MRISLEKVLLNISEKHGGRIFFEEQLKRHNSIFIGGSAFVWYEPVSLDELMEVLVASTDAGVDVVVIGNGSNVLMPDGHSEKVYLNLSHEDFCYIAMDDEEITAGAGSKLSAVISQCCSKGLAGLEGMVGIPGTIGGAITKNAGYTSSIGTYLKAIKVIDAENNIKLISGDDIRFGYRSSSLDKDNIIIEAVFDLKREQPQVLIDRLKSLFLEKMSKQPLDERTLGCVFKNPHEGGYSAGKLIDEAGLKKLKHGGAIVSEKHANFIVNSGNAMAHDVRELIDKIRCKVREKFGVELELEIEVLG